MQPSAAIARQLADYDKNRVTSTDALNSALATYGVPEIRNTVSGLRTTVANTTNALNAVDPSVTGRTSGSLVTEAQRSRIVNNERAPIAQNLSDENGALSQNQQDLKDAMDQATTEANNKVNDYNTGRAALQSEYDTAYKSEQDAAAAAAQKAQQDREYQLAVQQAAASRAAASSKSAAVPAAQQKMAQIAQIANQLVKNVGKDGKVSNETWAAALNDFTATGGSVRTFWQNYGHYVNPKYAKSYAGYAVR